LIAGKAMNSQHTTNLKISCSQFADGGNIPARYTCKGVNVNPPLEISGVPQTTKSLALILRDPDAPSGDWAHWLVWNIEPATTQIPEGALPIGAVEGTTSFKTTGYGGPCPHSGTHHYIFELYALDTKLDLEQSATHEELVAALNGHILAKTTLTGLFSKD
jgi:Raf kinase inhibitor-like YbhB/YbcL family protein